MGFSVMGDHIEAILFDMGGTLRHAIETSDTVKVDVVRNILALLGSEIPADSFAEKLTERSNDYSFWARETLIELDEVNLWTKWLLPDWPFDQISKLAIPLNNLWRDATAKRIIFPEVRKVVLELHRRGYRLGLVSRTVSSLEVPQAFDKLQLSHCFETVILSCVVGIRKPNPAIFNLALADLGVSPHTTAYVGDRPDRDVAGARSAGIAKTVIIQLKEPLDIELLSEELTPDHWIHSHKQLLDIFPPLLSPEKARTN
jgi:HAD superfamily hydrolase (TIGR01509 family)